MCRFNDSAPVPVLLAKLSLPRDVALPFLMRSLLGHAVALDSTIIRTQPTFEEPSPCELKG
jgi:hypothetical protein